MDAELFESLEKRVQSLLDAYLSLKSENVGLKEENARLLREREGFKERINSVLAKLEGIQDI